MKHLPLYTLFLFAFLLNSSGLVAQKSDNEENIIDLSKRFHLWIYGKQKFTDITFNDEINKQTLTYASNDPFNIGMGFNWRFIRIGIALNFKFINNDDQIYGDTKRLDLQMNAFGNRSVFDLTFLFYKSYYLRNMEDVFPGWESGDPYYIRGDMAMASFGMAYTYIFNHKRFSYKAAFVSNAIQKRSAGSFFLGGKFNFTSLVSDSSMFPKNSDFATFDPINELNRNSLSLVFGYAYNVILPKYFYFSPSLALTPSVGILRYDSYLHSPYRNSIPGVGLVPRMAFGYNGLAYFAGVSMNTTVLSVDSKDDNIPGINWQNGNVRIFVGKRF
ncbi:MAG: DUF4421 family protein [Bacteroidales bacterium]|nr:DUF4421 family protein [Bacteroidales bacterium]